MQPTTDREFLHRLWRHLVHDYLENPATDDMRRLEKLADSVITATEVLEAMQTIVDDRPGTLDHAEDGRYTWPARWTALRDWLTTNLTQED